MSAAVAGGAAIGCADKLSIFGHGLWAFIKGGIAILMAIAAILQFTDVTCSLDASNIAVVSVAGTVTGVLLVIGAILIFTDSFGAKMLLNRFRREIARLSGEVNRLEDVRRGLEETDDNLKERNAELVERNEEIAESTDELKKQVVGLIGERDALARQVAAFEASNKKFQQSNATLESEVKRLGNATKAQDLQIQRLQIVETMANDLLDNLKTNGDDFTAFGQILEETTDRQEDVTNRMERIQRELALARFRELDADGDGMVSEAELNRWAAQESGSGNQ